MEGSTSELIMCAMALDRWDEAPEGWRNAPWKAWSFRLNDSQREAVQAGTTGRNSPPAPLQSPLRGAFFAPYAGS